MAVDDALYRRLKDAGLPHAASLILADSSNTEFQGGLIGGGGGGGGGGGTLETSATEGQIAQDFEYDSGTDALVQSGTGVGVVNGTDVTVDVPDGLYELTAHLFTTATVAGVSVPASTDFSVSIGERTYINPFQITQTDIDNDAVSVLSAPRVVSIRLGDVIAVAGGNELYGSGLFVSVQCVPVLLV